MIFFNWLVLMMWTARSCGGGCEAYLLNKKGTRNAAGEDLGGVLPFKATILLRLYFGTNFGIAYFLAFHSWPLSAAVALWSGGWMLTGHGTVLQWGTNPAAAQSARRQTLTPLIDFMARLFSLEIGGLGYCRIFMAVKGFLIGLPVGGVILAVLWPACYEIGNGRIKRQEISELLTGVSAFVAIMAPLVILELFGGYNVFAEWW